MALLSHKVDAGGNFENAIDCQKTVVEPTPHRVVKARPKSVGLPALHIPLSTFRGLAAAAAMLRPYWSQLS